MQLATTQALAALLGGRLRLAQGRGQTKRDAAVRHRDRRSRTFISSTFVRSTKTRCRSIITHGWPGSIIEQMKVIGPLTDPTAHGASASDAFHLVIPSIPGYGYSPEPASPRLGSRAHRQGLGRADAASRIRSIRRARRRLGRVHHATDGVARAGARAGHSQQHARHRSRPTFWRRQLPTLRRPPGSRATSCTRIGSWPTSTRITSGTPSRWRTARKRSTD